MTNPVCWLTRRRLGAYQDGELRPAARAKVERHLAGCAGCGAERAALDDLRTLLAGPIPEPPEPVWDAFWPQVRARLADSPVEQPSRWRRGWAWTAGAPRLAVGSALAVAALGVVTVLAPWQETQEPPGLATPAPGAAVHEVVVHSVETGDPQSSVMVFASQESDVTVVWVFGLERTKI